MKIYDQRLKKASDSLKSKIFDSLSLIENKFGIKFDLKINDHGKEIVFNGYKSNTLKAYQKHGDIVFKSSCDDNEFILNAYDFQFSIPNAIQSLFIVSFDDAFNIKSVRFSSFSTFQKIQNGISRITVLFDNFFELSNIEYYSTIGHSFTKKHDNLLSFDEDALLFKLLTNNDEEIKTLLPESHIPSAYNFHSVEFKNRLSIYEMMTL